MFCRICHVTDTFTPLAVRNTIIEEDGERKLAGVHRHPCGHWTAFVAAWTAMPAYTVGPGGQTAYWKIEAAHTASTPRAAVKGLVDLPALHPGRPSEEACEALRRCLEEFESQGGGEPVSGDAIANDVI